MLPAAFWQSTTCPQRLPRANGSTQPAVQGARQSQTVSVTGSFSSWGSPAVLARSAETQDFICSLPLSPGLHQYKYLVDEEWATSPCEPVTMDAKGRRNHHRVVASSAEFSWAAAWGGSEVFVTGDFAGWSELIPLAFDVAAQRYQVSCSLPPGVYAFQYLVDGKWLTSPDAPVAHDEEGHLCNQIDVKVPPAYRIFYATTWHNPTLQYQIQRDGQAGDQGWQQTTMASAGSLPSRASPTGGWRTAVIPVPQGAPASTRLRFHIDGPSQAEVDRPYGGGEYTCCVPGGFKLQRGRMLPFPQAQAAPIMVVSDLDGTMVGEGPEADAATRAFCAYWENTAALAGGVLVYNTGRSLGQFQELLQTKADCLAVPNALITAVGTKIFWLRRHGTGPDVNTLDWVEDLAWQHRLSHNWDLAVVREVGAQVIAECGGDGHAHWLDDGSEHPHRIALSMQASCVLAAKASLQQKCAARNLKVQVIVSGAGDWRYVDCVSGQGGKLQALEHVRTMFSIPRSHCMSAGDSGNDILMLEGGNPGVIVGNAQPELLDWLVTQKQDKRLRLADAHLAYGILEGLALHGLR
ncbi:hypothetical protein WJX73_000994 [Symbiochloris irregularis]|uniref:Sucrose phosphatase-like domain-containing protein n=1 Tax=Symbiochloris irregularis TaxID=706552 RepID=A0AAW1PLT6_9CHLO